MVGYATSGATTGSLVLLILPLLLGIAFMLIADIDSPRGGGIHVAAQNMAALSETMH
jgi:hypothetical protein